MRNAKSDLASEFERLHLPGMLNMTNLWTEKEEEKKLKPCQRVGKKLFKIMYMLNAQHIATWVEPVLMVISGRGDEIQVAGFSQVAETSQTHIC